ncbi:MAG TPA: LLM class flavin-dependent oxidoreductase, partial [Thermoanaerobaculia bacterium]|nr:LLM class flavin-dependent oxidoreductase [Thermoanaerobaculia bacterium]
MTRMPALSLAAVPGRRRRTLELARRIEELGFAGIYCPSVGDGMALCQGIATVTRTIPFGTSIANIYTRHPLDFAATAAFVHELSEGRFRFGIGVSHGPAHERLGIVPGKPLAEIRRYVDELRAAPGVGELPPIVLATLRDKMTALAGEIADGCVWANGSRSHMRHSLSLLPADKRSDDAFFIGNMIPTCIHDDDARAAAVNRRTLTRYATLPNYRNYWKAAGYVEEMEGVERAIAAGEIDRIPEHLSDRWLADCTLFGPAAKVREDVERWFDTGMKTPILVPSSAEGNQMQAFE